MPIDCLSLALNSFLFLFMLSIKAFSWVYLQTQTALSQQLMRYKVFISQVTIDGESEGVPLCRWCLKKSIYETCVYTVNGDQLPRGWCLGTKAVRRYLANSASATTGLPLIIFVFVGSVLVSRPCPVLYAGHSCITNRYQAMEAERIASLKLRADDCFGDAIQAIARNDDKKYIDSKIDVLKCYRIRSYVCVPISPAVNVVSHSVHLRIGTATSIDSIPDTDVLPHHYFEFCDYEKLDTLRGDSHQLIDFIGLLQGMEEKTTKDHNPFLNLTLCEKTKHPSNSMEGDHNITPQI
ncbi:hypothetical protein L1987_44964 [Smallanthus sonchifolius]|uniref:Uncharacterized protein n=1 Tax=Smallanthus sonchifolius TaxID=185202 RepID=A0ACB9GRY4_9ASTR|nr:hypothetical protein L1987_44964 [Smallanthus sonchifolius]